MMLCSSELLSSNSIYFTHSHSTYHVIYTQLNKFAINFMFFLKKQSQTFHSNKMCYKVTRVNTFNIKSNLNTTL